MPKELCGINFANVNSLTKTALQVSLLNSIRHENVILFMGACIEAPDLAVVTR